MRCSILLVAVFGLTGSGSAASKKISLSPLGAAVQEGSRERVEAALQAGEDPGQRDADGLSALGRLMYHPELSGALLEHCASIYIEGQNCAGALYYAAQYGRLDVVKALLAKGASAKTSGSSGLAPIFGVASGPIGDNSPERPEHAEIARLLLENGADPNVQDSNGLPPLYLAISNRRPLVAKLLLERGADPNAKGHEGKPLLFWAAWEGEPEVTKTLIDKGAETEPAVAFLRQAASYYEDQLKEPWGGGVERSQLEAARSAMRLVKKFSEQRQAAASPPAAASSVSREELTAIVKAALKTSQSDQPPAPSAPKEDIQSDVDSPKYKAPEDSNRFAVVIGVEKYSNDLPEARFAAHDARAVRAHLLALGYPARNIVLLIDQEATRAGLAKTLNSWLPNRVAADSTVFFYYSGHGAPDPQTNQAFLVPADGDAEDLDSTAYPIKQLYAKLGALKARRVIVALDSCFSGAGGRSVLAKGARPLVNRIEMGNLPSQVIALTASDKGQISGTMDEQGHGAFTYYLLKGLGGAARNDSGHVTVRSLYDYLTPKVQDAARLHNRNQTPQLFSGASAVKGSELQLR